MPLLEKSEITRFLYEYYKTTYGELETDYWYEQPAVNVWVFRRKDDIIALNCNILTGEVKEKIEKIVSEEGR